MIKCAPWGCRGLKSGLEHSLRIWLSQNFVKFGPAVQQNWWESCRYLHYILLSQYVTIKLFFYHIHIKLISREIHTWSFISTPFCDKEAFLHKVYALPKPARVNTLITLIGPSFCYSINKKLSPDFFPDREGHRWVSTRSLISHSHSLQTTALHLLIEKRILNKGSIAFF